jgi:hypothetical protein
MKRVTISVDERWWGGVRVAALREGVSVGKFLMGMYPVAEKHVKADRSDKSVKADKHEDVVKADDVKKLDKSDKIAELRSTGDFNPQPKTPEAKVEVKETPFQRMKRLHQNDQCLKCGELNKNCKCEG